MGAARHRHRRLGAQLERLRPRGRPAGRLPGLEAQAADRSANQRRTARRLRAGSGERRADGLPGRRRLRRAHDRAPRRGQAAASESLKQRREHRPDRLQDARMRRAGRMDAVGLEQLRRSSATPSSRNGTSAVALACASSANAPRTRACSPARSSAASCMPTSSTRAPPFCERSIIASEVRLRLRQRQAAQRRRWRRARSPRRAG